MLESAEFASNSNNEELAENFQSNLGKLAKTKNIEDVEGLIDFF